MKPFPRIQDGVLFPRIRDNRLFIRFEDETQNEDETEDDENFPPKGYGYY